MYRGSFAGRSPRAGESVDWKVEIWGTPTATFNPETPIELRFPKESPLTIEWEEWKPEQAVQGAMAVLTVISEGDRDFAHIYATHPGEWVLQVYRRAWEPGLYHDQELLEEYGGWRAVWSGSLDPEFYEEPYERNSNYEVSLTFSDFGALDLEKVSPKYFEDYMVSIRDIIDKSCRLLSDIGFGKIHVATGISLFNYDNEEFALSDYLDKVCVNIFNFEDEEREWSSWRSMLEGVLMPLGLNLVQRGGKVVLYDTEHVRAAIESDAEETGLEPWVAWSGNSQTMGTAERYGKCTVGFSPYGLSTIISPDIETDLNDPKAKKYAIYNALTKTNGQPKAGSLWCSFLWTAATGGTSAWDPVGSDEAWGYIEPYLGSAPGGSVFRFRGFPQLITINRGITNGHIYLRNPNLDYIPVLMRAESKFIPQVDVRQAPFLIFKMDMLWDPRFSPFEEAHPADDDLYNFTPNSSDDNSWGRYKKLTNYGVAMPVRIYLKDFEGNIRYIYSPVNQLPTELSSVGRSGNTGWVDFKNGNVEDLMKKSTATIMWSAHKGDNDDTRALKDFTTNSPLWYPAYDSKTKKERHEKLPDGLIMHYPPIAGTIVVEVLDGLHIGLPTSLSNESVRDEAGQLARHIPWRLFKSPSLEVADITGEAPKYQDTTTTIIVDDSGEELSVDTLCGAVRMPTMTELGLYRIGEDNEPVWCMSRAGIKNYIDRTLGNALLSQYAGRRITLSGEAYEDSMRLIPVMADHNTRGLFMIASSVLDCIAGTEEMSLVQLMPDKCIDKDFWDEAGQWQGVIIPPGTFRSSGELPDWVGDPGELSNHWISISKPTREGGTEPG